MDDLPDLPEVALPRRIFPVQSTPISTPPSSSKKKEVRREYISNDNLTEWIQSPSLHSAKKFHSVSSKLSPIKSGTSRYNIKKRLNYYDDEDLPDIIGCGMKTEKKVNINNYKQTSLKQYFKKEVKSEIKFHKFIVKKNIKTGNICIVPKSFLKKKSISDEYDAAKGLTPIAGPSSTPAVDMPILGEIVCNSPINSCNIPPDITADHCTFLEDPGRQEE